MENAEGDISVRLCCGKSRAIPRAGQTIVRAELEAVRLTAELVTKIKQELSFKEVEVFCYSDSKVVLAYIAKNKRKFKTFVSNRVRDIRNLVGSQSFRFVTSEENPADYASRGLNAVNI
jgi:hypothetical protein